MDAYPLMNVPSVSTLVTVYVVLYALALALSLVISARAWRGYMRVRHQGPAHLISEQYEHLRSGLAGFAGLLAYGAVALIAYLVL
ncbi:hypothetical protein [Nocardia salmonicida]|uniref:hypothetical protein n=1 Tax=Nocardia salmonicida TaxID=53431 RepID=UPI0007A4C92F|nr:hypothetical protein [Nocardia salmonicida]